VPGGPTFRTICHRASAARINFSSAGREGAGGAVLRPSAPGRPQIALVEFSPSGGLFQFGFQLGRGLASHGYAIDLVTGHDPELTSDAPGFRMLDILPSWHPGSASVESLLLRKSRRILRGVQHVRAWLRLLRYIDHERPDVVVWSTWRFPIDSWLVIATRRRHPDVVLGRMAHETLPLREQPRSGSLYRTSRIVNRSLAAAYQRMDMIFVLGSQARESIVRTWKPRGEVAVIPHGDESIFAGEDVPAADRTPPRVLFFGTWTRYKGIDLLLEAFQLVRNQVPSAELMVAGSVGADVDFDAIRKKAAAIGGVDLRPGYVPMEQVATLMGGARVVAIPYLRASQSGVVHLAQTFGRPVVATAVGDIPEAVPDGVAGLVVPPADPVALAAALRRLLDGPDTALRMGEAGRRRLQAEGSWHDIAARVADVTERVRAGGKPPSADEPNASAEPRARRVDVR
jgi:glycosyltransferase involved in cell wall biosynthesis